MATVFKPCGQAQAQGLESRLDFGRAQVGLGQDDHRRDAAALYQREVTLQATRAEVRVQAHHQQRGIDVAGKHLWHAVHVAARELGLRRNARVRPPVTVTIALGQQPVTDGQRVAVVDEAALQSRQHTQREFGHTVVHAQRLAVNLGHAQRRTCQFLSGHGDRVRHRRRQPDRPQPIEIHVLHLEFHPMIENRCARAHAAARFALGKANGSREESSRRPAGHRCRRMPGLSGRASGRKRSRDRRQGQSCGFPCASPFGYRLRAGRECARAICGRQASCGAATPAAWACWSAW